jgi:adenylosuccinate lyase
MRANLEASRGLVFSQAALNTLIRAGVSREDAYRAVQEAAGRAMENGTDLESELQADGRLELGPGALGAAFDLDTHLAHADHALTHLEGITAEWLRASA